MLHLIDVAELLYVQLLSDPGDGDAALFPSSEAVNEASSLLTETNWAEDSSASVEGVVPAREARKALLALAGIESSASEVVTGAEVGKKGTKKDKWDTYDSLVRDAGY